MEDACVMAEVLQEVIPAHDLLPELQRIEAAFFGYERIRKPRFEKVLDYSFHSFDTWSQFWRPGLTAEDVTDFQTEAEMRFRWMWNSDIEGQGKRAKAETRRILDQQLLGQKHPLAKLS